VIPPTPAKPTAAAAATANADVSSANDVRFVDSMKGLHIAGAGVKLESLDAVSLPAGESLRYRVLYAAPVSNNKSWDALLVEDESVAYVLQTTVDTGQARRSRSRCQAAEGARLQGRGEARVSRTASRVC
jgi:hypothetical protein